MGQRKPIYSPCFHALDSALLQPRRGEFSRQLISKENSIHTHVPPQIDVSVGSPTPDPTGFFQHWGRGCMLRVWTAPPTPLSRPSPAPPWGLPWPLGSDAAKADRC